MATTNCPSCNRLVSVPEELFGRAVRCPSCGNVFTVSAPDDPEVRTAPAIPSRTPSPASSRGEVEDEGQEEDYEEEPRPRKRRRRSRREAARNLVMGPAIALMAAAGLGIVIGLFFLVGAVAGPAQPPPPPPNADAGFRAGYAFGFHAGRYGPGVLSVIGGLVLLIGSILMLQMRSYGMAITTAIIALVPCHCSCLLGVPFGIWALIVLNREDVREAFG
jgi:hypothetical protein